MHSSDNTQYGVWLRASTTKPGLSDKHKRKEGKSYSNSHNGDQQVENVDLEDSQISFGNESNSAQEKTSIQETPKTTANLSRNHNYGGGAI